MFKLDASLPLQSDENSGPVSTATTINTINISEIDNVTTIEFNLNHKAEFSVFTLDNPDRLVVDLKNTQMLEALPSALDHSYLQGIRYSNQVGDNLRLVLDSNRPIMVDNTKIFTKGEGYLLSISLLATKYDEIEQADFINTVPVEQESSYGQMEVKQSSDNAEISLERYLADVRQMYSQKDYEKGDEAIQAILQKHPLNVEARTLYASTLINRNYINSAIQVLTSELRRDPEISEWAKLYARLLVEQGQVNSALVVLEGALPEITEDYDYYAMYAALLQREARHQDAIENYKNLLGYHPENGLWWMGLAISQNAINDSSDAHYSFNMALQGQSINYELRQYILQQIQRLSN